jgi:hypothetical protein
MRPRLAVLALAVCGALCLPASAGADVRSELAQASAAIDAAIDAADAGDGTEMAAQIAANTAYTDQARRLVRSLPSAKQRARWLGRVGEQYEDNLTEYIWEVSFVNPALQVALANAVVTNLQARQRTVVSLTRMLRRLPEAGQSRALDTIAGLTAAGEIEAMVETVLDPDVIDQAKALIQAQVQAAVAQMQAVVDRLDLLLDRLPPEIRAYIHDAIEEITNELDGIPAMVNDLLDGLLAYLDPGEFFDFGPFCGLLQGLPVPVPVPVCD